MSWFAKSCHCCRGLAILAILIERSSHIFTIEGQAGGKKFQTSTSLIIGHKQHKIILESADKFPEYRGYSRLLHFAFMNTFILAIAVIPTKHSTSILFLFFGKLLMQVTLLHIDAYKFICSS